MYHKENCGVALVAVSAVLIIVLIAGGVHWKKMIDQKKGKNIKETIWGDMSPNDNMVAAVAHPSNRAIYFNRGTYL